MKSSIIVSLLVLFLVQHDNTLKIEELKNLVGCWNGTLTYLDYSSGKPYTMSANVRITKVTNMSSFVYALSYPKEPQANSVDTISVSLDGKIFNGESIKLKRHITKDSLELITEVEGVDGNKNEKAILRHYYLIGKKTYSSKKEVQFSGRSEWITRNEYKFHRKSCD